MSPAAAKSEAEAVRHFLARNGLGFVRDACRERASRPPAHAALLMNTPLTAMEGMTLHPGVDLARADGRVIDQTHLKTQRANAPVFSANGER